MATEDDVVDSIKYATLVIGEWVASISASMISFIRRLGVADTTMEDGFPPKFHQAINATVDQSINDVFEDHLPPALKLNIEAAVTDAIRAALPDALRDALPDALATALPPLLAPMEAKLTRIETKQTDMDTRLTRMETKQTDMEAAQARTDAKLTRMDAALMRVEITQAKVLSIEVFVVRLYINLTIILVV